MSAVYTPYKFPLKFCLITRPNICTVFFLCIRMDRGLLDKPIV